MRRFACLLACVSILLAGCIPSLHPVFTEKDRVFAPALLGTWAADGAKESWTFSAHDPWSYRLVHVDDKERRGIFTAHLVKIGAATFLDLQPAEPGSGTTAFYNFHLLPAHTFFLVHQIEPRLRVSAMSADWLKQHLKRNPGAIRHEVVDDQIVITAPTEALQAFLAKHAATPDAFAKPTEVARR